jgi:hypothetical protein
LSPFKETIEGNEGNDEERRRAGWPHQTGFSGNPIEAEEIQDLLFGTMPDYVSELLLQESKPGDGIYIGLCVPSVSDAY